MLKARAQIAPVADGQKTRTFRMVANTGEPMNIWPYEHPVVVDLDTIDLSGLPVPALYDHCPDVDFAVGQVQAARVNGSELVAEGVFTVTETASPDRNYARKVLDKADAGYVWQTSIGGDPKAVENIAAGQTVMVNGRTYAGPVCVARGVTLREISFVVLGGDRKTSAVVATGGKKMAAVSFEDFVQSMGFTPEKLDETQAANMRRVHSEMYPEGGDDEPKEEAAAAGTTEVKAEGEEETPKEEEQPTNAAAKKSAIRARGKRTVSQPDPTVEIRAKAAGELKRVREIQALAAKYGQPTIEIQASNGEKTTVPAIEHAIEAGLDVDKAELLILRASRTSGPATIDKGHDRNCTMQALEGALLLRAGFNFGYKFRKPQAAIAMGLPGWIRAGINDADRNRFMENAHQFSSLSAVDLCREACRLDGIDAPRDYSDLIRAAIRGPGLRAASSGSALTQIFSTSIHAQLLSSYEQSPDTTAGWTSESDVANFQSQERARVDLGEGLKNHPRGKEAEHAKYSDSYESYKIARYSRQFVVDEIDLLDDNLGGLSRVPTDMGMAAARLRPDLVYSIILDNPTLNATSRDLFNTTDGNLITTGGALTAATLRDGIADMSLFQENSVNLNLQATHLLVGPDNELLGWELTQSPQILYGADDETVRGNLNALKQKGITPVSEPRLQNGVTDPRDGTAHSGDANAWYLVCANAHTIEVGYLRGTGRAPRVRSEVLTMGRYGMQWDCSLSIGAAPLDWKGMYKNEGGA